MEIDSSPHPYLLERNISEALGGVIGAYRVIETHLSLLTVGERYTIKFKKPVHFPFVNYTDLLARAEGSRTEVEINRRLSVGIYLGYAVVRADGTVVLSDSFPPLTIEICEVGVWMATIPSDEFFAVALKNRSIRDTELVEIAKRLATFHSSLIPTRYGSAVSYREAIVRHTDENLTALLAHSPSVVPFGYDIALHRLVTWLRAVLPELAPLFEQRFAEGWVREGHGDLRADHIVLHQGSVHCIDAIEFAPEYRIVDLLDEISFLEMDLAFRGYPKLAARLRQEYLRVSGTPWNHRLHTFFFVYRATVRMKVALLSPPEALAPGEWSPAERLLALATGATYHPPDRAPDLICMTGLPGTGKSTLAGAIGLTLGAEVIRSDAVRRRLYGAPRRVGEANDRYQPEQKEAVYRMVFEEASRSLTNGKRVVLDATFSTRATRERALEIARSRGVRCTFIECRLDEGEAIKRLEARHRDSHSLSDAGPAQYAGLRAGYETPTPLEGYSLIGVDTATPLVEQIAHILRSLLD